MGLIIKIPLLFLNKEKSWIHSIKTIRLDLKGSNVDKKIILGPFIN